jgi:hypothetical protein
MSVKLAGNTTATDVEVETTSKAMRTIKYDARGNSIGMRASYSACTPTKLAAVAGTTVFAQIYGSGSKTIRVQRIVIAGTIVTTAIAADLVIFKRTAAGTGGTATTLTPVAKDSGSAAGTATVVKFFTAAPTAGTGGGIVATQNMALSVAPAMGPAVIFDWTNEGMNEAPVLRGVAEGLELSFATTAGNVATLTVSFEWTEE